MTLLDLDPMGAVIRGVLKVRCEALLSGIVLGGERYYFWAIIGLNPVAIYLKFDSEPTVASATPFYLLPVFQDRGIREKGCIHQRLILKPTKQV